MCIRIGEVDPWQPEDVSDHIKTQDMCDDAISEDLCWKYLIDNQEMRYENFDNDEELITF